MKKLVAGLMIALVCGLCGCDLVSYGLSDIQGWNMSACGENMSAAGTCYQLFSDNETQILGGKTTVEYVTDQFWHSNGESE